MELDASGADVLDIYNMLVRLVTPRPIAWVTSLDLQGRVNLAPFSFFNVFGSNPPVVAFSPNLRRDRTKKDTLLNVEATGEFVVNAAVIELAEKVNLTSKEIPPGESEVDLAGLHLLPSVKVKPPRVAESPAAMECKVLQIIPIGDGPAATNLILGQVLYFHVDDAVLEDNGRPDPRKYRTVARLGGETWCRATDLFELKRP